MVSAPELKGYTNKALSVQLNGSRVITGILKGYDIFLNLTMENAAEINQKKKGEKLSIGTCVIRGNSVVSVQVLE